jgi:hypothetical protein
MLTKHIESTYSIIVFQPNFRYKERIIVQFILCHPINETFII